jgi:hypothetical protein
MTSSEGTDSDAKPHRAAARPEDVQTDHQIDAFAAAISA